METLVSFQNWYVTKTGKAIWLEWTSVYIPDKEARNAKISIKDTGNNITLVVSDDGKGFEIGQQKKHPD